MAKKSFKITFTGSLTVIFTGICTFFFLIDVFALNGKLVENILSCPGGKAPVNPFNFTNPASYPRILLHIFAFTGPADFFPSIMMLLLLMPKAEEKFGCVFVCIMTASTALVAGVLTACISPLALKGCASIIFMLIIIEACDSISKKTIDFKNILLFIFFAAFNIYLSILNVKEKNWMEYIKALSPMLFCLAGGITGSLFVFLVEPKKKPVKKTSQAKEEEIQIQDIEKKSPKKDAQEEEIIGSIQL